MFPRGRGTTPPPDFIRHDSWRIVSFRNDPPFSVGKAGGGANSHDSRLIFVTGGARAGKSAFALKCAQKSSFRKHLFVATAVPCDEEMQSRIARHKKERNGAWKTLEVPLELPEKIPTVYLGKGSVVLLDCLNTFVANLLLAKRSPSQIESQVRSLLTRLRRPGLTAVVVSNEVGLGLVPESALGREFRDLLGAVNQQAASLADEVYFLVSGIPMKLK